MLTASCTCSTMVALVMKLSEARFKPLFLRLLEWVSASEGDGQAARSVLLFSCAEALGARLRSLFVPYFTYLIDAAIGHLGSKQPGDKPSTKKRRKSKDRSGRVGDDADEAELALLRFKVCLLSPCQADASLFT